MPVDFKSLDLDHFKITNQKPDLSYRTLVKMEEIHRIRTVRFYTHENTYT